MKEPPNIFQDVIRDEPTLTRLLVKFLGFGAFRKEFFTLFIKPNEAKLVEYEDIKINHCIENYGKQCKPDLAVKKDTFDIFIELKHRPFTGLTKHQPDSYYKYLAESSGEDKNKYLGLLIPQHYYHLNEWDKSIEKLRKRYRVAEIQIVQKTWLDAVDIISRNNFSIIHQVFNDFNELIRSFDLDIIKFEPNELQEVENDNWLKLLDKINRLVENLYESIGTSRVKWDANYYDYFGFYFKDKKGKATEIFFGVYYPEWKKSGKPLVLGITSEAPDRLRERYEEAVTKIFQQKPEPYKVDEGEDGLVAHLDVGEILGDPTKYLKDKLDLFWKKLFEITS
jgi:hypothetical protein